MQKKRRKRRRHSKRYKRRVRQLLFRFVLFLIILTCIIFIIIKANEKDEKVEPKKETPVVKEVPKKEIKKEEKIVRPEVVVLDPGHGGNDSGGVWEDSYEDIYEKEIDLAIVKEVEKILKKEGFTVICTRDTDTWVDLNDRSKIAEANQADVFVSVHQNAVENDTTSHGVETHCNENANAGSLDLATLIQESVIGETGARDRGLSIGSRLVVVQSQSVPSCLIETGFLTSHMERSLLMGKEYQKKIASGIAGGIKEYLDNKAEGAGEITADNQIQ